MKTLKDFLKMILPPPVRTFLREMGELRRLIEQKARLLEQGQRETLAAVERQAGELTRQLAEQTKLLEAQSAALKAQTERGEELRQTGAVLTEQAEALRQANEALGARLEQLERKQQAVLGQLKQEQQAVLGQLERKQQAALEELEKKQQETQATLKCFRTEADKAWEAASSQRKALSEAVEQTRRQSIEGARYASEAVWAETFNNAVSGSGWLKNTAFSPGRWAVGYPALYVLYRVLNEGRPKRILELGLGQSTRMIAQYAAAHGDVEHIVVEQDEEWIGFFKNDNALSARTQILFSPVEETAFRDDDKTLIYQNFDKLVGDARFDFVFIDGPAHSESKLYRRVELMKLIPDHLCPTFCIVLDDYDVPECRNAWQLAKAKLAEEEIAFHEGFYYGKKTISMFTNPAQKFLCTL